MSAIWAAWSADWLLYDKVSFDGANKVIYVHGEVTSFDIRTDLYTSWVDWSVLYDNLKYLPAIRSTGLDPIGGGQYTGDIYFLINGWKLVIDLQKVKVTGVLYSDDYDTAYYTTALVPQYPVTVAALVNTVATGGAGGATAYEVWSYSNRALSVPAPTAIQIRQEIDTNSTKLTSINNKVQTLTNGPTAVEIADQVRTELTPELSHLLTLENNTGLTNTQATMILEMYELLGLDPTKPLIVTGNSRTAGAINQTINTSTASTVVTRV